MKRIIFMMAIILNCLMAVGQDIKFTKGQVFIDGQECLKINSSDPNNVSILDMEGNEIIFLKYIHDSRYGSLYNKVTFLDQKRSFTSISYIFTIKQLIKKLVTDKTIENCKLNPDKVDKFIMKYDEDVEKPVK